VDTAITSLVISGIALTVSIGRFVYDARREAITKRLERTQKSRIAFRLGSNLMEQWQMLVLVGKGDPAEIEKFHDDVLMRVGSSQVLADQLGLKVDLRKWLERKDRGMVLEGLTNPFSELRSIIDAMHSKSITGKGHENAVNDYRKLVDGINRDLANAGPRATFDPKLNELSAIAEEAKRVMESVSL